MKAFRLMNVRGFADTGWIDLKPLTLLTGWAGSWMRATEFDEEGILTGACATRRVRLS
jgi:hypothetical protein